MDKDSQIMTLEEEIIALKNTILELEKKNTDQNHNIIETEIRDLQEFQDKIISNMHVGISSYRYDGQCVSTNNAMGAVVGATREQVLSQNFRKIESWKKSGLLDDALEVLDSGVEKIREIQLVSTFDKKIWIETTMSKFMVKNEPHLLLMAYDITESKKSEEGIKKEKEFTDTVFNTLIDTLFVFDPSTGKAIRWNKSFTEISGYSNEEIASLKAPESYYSENDLKKAASAIDKTVKLGIATVEIDLITKHGKKIPTEYRVAPIIDESGKTKLLVSVGRDVTERKELKEYLNGFMEEASDAFYILNDKMNFISINKKALMMAGCKSKEEIIGKHITEIVPDIIETGRYDEHLKVMKTGNPYVVQDFIPHPKFGNVHYILKSFKVGNVLGVIVSDISQLKKAEKENEEMHKQVFHSAKLAAIGELAAGVGHEINNPLAIIKGNLEILKEMEQEGVHNRDKVIRRIEKIENASFRIENIVKGLRNFSRFDDEKRENIDLDYAVNETISLISILYDKEGIKVDTIFKTENCQIFGNLGKIQQVIMNLLSNAKDAVSGMENGNIFLETQEINDKVYLKVRDNGRGINKDHLERIFDPFFTTKDIGKGSGLGLGICKAIIERMDGEIKIESTLNKGTEVTINFPKFALKKPDKKVKTVTKYKKLSGSVLVVDDEEDIRELLNTCISGFGLRVDEACDGYMALDLIKHNKYDYLITDIKMPRMSGGKLISEIRKHDHGSMKIFVITGAIDLDEDYLEKLKLDYLADGSIEKPFSKDQIYHLLKKKK